MKYSIWIIPPEPVYSTLKTIISNIAKQYGGPMFEPHMTILGDINRDVVEIEKNIKKLAAGINTLELSLGDVSFSTTYFQSVFVRICSTADLMQLNLDAKKIFERENNVFMPHISLLYGNHDMVTREKAASKIQLPHTSFVVHDFIITPSTESPSEWAHSATIPFC